MNALRLLIACVWLTLGFAASASAVTPSAGKHICPVHMQTMHAQIPDHHMPPHDVSAMACSSLPAIAAPAPATFAPAPAGVWLNLSPAPAVIRPGIAQAFEPHPPKAEA